MPLVIGIADDFTRLSVHVPDGTNTQQCAEALRNFTGNFEPEILFTAECIEGSLQLHPVMTKGTDYQ